MKVLVMYDYPPSPGGLATQGDLLTLMTNADLRDKMGKAGRERVVANFDYRIVAKKFVQIMNDKLGIK